MSNTPAQQKQSIGNFLNFPNTQKFLESNLKEKKGEFVSNLIALYDADKSLQACDPQKLMMCAMNATSLNLPLNKNLGYAYIIPYKGIPQFQIGYKGLIQLAIRTGMYETINACEIREGEVERNKITGAIKFIDDKPNNKIVGYLAYLKLTSGFSASLYMTVDEIEKHALKFSQAYTYDKKNGKRSSKWSDPDARSKMALKTVLKGLLGTYGVMTTDMASAIDNDSDNEDVAESGRNIQNAEIVDQSETVPETKKVNLEEL